MLGAGRRIGLAQPEADRQTGGAGVGAHGDRRGDAEVEGRHREVAGAGRAGDVDIAGVATRRQRDDVGDGDRRGRQIEGVDPGQGRHRAGVGASEAEIDVGRGKRRPVAP